MMKLQDFGSKQSPTDSVMDTITSFRRHPSSFRNLAILHKLLPVCNDFGAKTCNFKISDQCVISCTFYHNFKYVLGINHQIYKHRRNLRGGKPAPCALALHRKWH